MAVAAIALLASSTPPAQAEGAGAIRDLPGCASNTLPPNDDGSTPVVPIGFTADFFGLPFDQLYVNNNGNVTFTSALYKYTPFDFTTSGDVMIAPFLADVDTRNPESAAVTYGETSVDGHPTFCVDWIDVGYYDERIDKKNSFQLLLVSEGSGDFDIEFNYDEIQWETGDASRGAGGLGGTSATVGFANGDGDETHFFVRDGSYENGALLDGGSKALTAGSLDSGGQIGRYVFHVRNVPLTGASLSGEVKDPLGNPVSGSPVDICPQAGGPCVARLSNATGVYRMVNLPAGGYTVTAHSAAQGIEYADGHAGPLAVSGTDSFVQDVTLGNELTGPPPGTDISGVGASGNGVPVLYWEEPSTLSTEGCPNGKASYRVILGGAVAQSGQLDESPVGSGDYSTAIPPLFPNHGNGQVQIEITDCSSPSTVEFGIYIDPSGVVRDVDTGAPIDAATVTLLRAVDPAGPFIQVPDGSATMSPANRRNPDVTGAGGRFGWDVIAGYYKVQATASGCSPSSSGVLTIPPPVTDLELELDCGHAKGGGGGGPKGGGGGLVSPPGATASIPSAPSGHGKRHRTKHKRCKGKRHGHKRRCGSKKKSPHHR